MSKRYIISGGGTGGHIFPAISIANSLKAIDSGNSFLFVGAQGKMEMIQVPKAGYDIVGLNITGIEKKLTAKALLFPFRLVQSLVKSVQIIKQFKPHCVIGVGGYASGPLLLAAQWLGVTTVIQEQNAFPGKTNKYLAKKVKRAYVAYEGMDKWFPAQALQLFGNPVRQNLLEIPATQAQALSFFGLQNNKKTILIVGGSQGALSINNSLKASFQQLKNSNFQFIWQTGKKFYEENQGLLQAPNVYLTPFIDKMEMAYAAADLVVSRAGAGAISELAVVKKPCILIPFPFAADDHQLKNARALSHKNAALLIEDKEVNSLTDKMLSLLENKEELNVLTKNIALFEARNAAHKIAQDITNLKE